MVRDSDFISKMVHSMDFLVSQPKDLEKIAQTEQPLWKVLLRATIIFVSVSFFAFGALNAKALYQQLTDALDISNNHADLLTDTDHDGLPDWWEKTYSFDQKKAGEALEDPDQEKLVNIQEFVYRTDPRNADSDGDGKNDLEEVLAFEDPNAPGLALDSDGDTMPDWFELSYGFHTARDDAGADVDNDQLTNAKEFVYGTDPRNPDTDGDGFNDGAEVEQNYNPLGEGKLDTDRDKLTDTEEKNYRTNITVPDTDTDGLKDGEEVHVYQSNPLVADTDGDGFNDGAEVEAGYDPTKKGAKLNLSDRDDDGLTLEQEEGIATDPTKADTDGDGFNDGAELALGLDPTNSDPKGRPAGRLLVDKINIGPPIVWVQENTEAAFQAGLAQGVIHVPSTVYPGEKGNAYITGHSSDYVYKPGEFKTILAKQAELGIGDRVEIELTFKSGKKRIQTWKMFEKNIVTPDDPVLFREESRPILTLATCWPLNTSWKRLYQKYDLEKIEYK